MILTYVLLPWWNIEGELEYSQMTFDSGTENEIDRRLAFRLIRKWYKSALGRSVPKYVLTRVWSRRHNTRKLTEAELQDKFDELARRSYEEIEDITDSELQENTGREAGR